MIKNFEEYINEDYFSKLANRKDTGDARKENEITEEFVRSLIDEDSGADIKSVTIRKENGKSIVDIDGDFYLSKDVEKIPFQFGKVTGDCSLSNCEKLKSLEGCPIKVGGYFSCSGCVKLTSLEGAPQEVGSRFHSSFCKRLTSLEGCPKDVGSNFYCTHCGKKFTESEVKSLCNVKGDILL